MSDGAQTQRSAGPADQGPDLRHGTSQARWVIAATVLGSGMVFLDSTVVNVALPAIADDLDTSLAGLQWTVNAFLVTLSSLLLLGGSLGDRLGRRRVFVAGLVTFTAASVLCGVAPNTGFLVIARALQGAGGALLVPGSLAIISSSFHPDDRGRAIGTWSGLSGVSTAVGPFLGGWLIDALTWRLIFLINVPIAVVAVLIAQRHVPETRTYDDEPLDFAGASLITIALAAISYAAIEHGGGVSIAAGVLGAVALGAFLVVEAVSSHPMLPLRVFRSRQFTGSNITTFAVYAGLSAALFFVVLRLQYSLGYSPLEAGASLVPFTLILLVLSPVAGQVGQRIGPRTPMTIGPLVVAVSMWLFSQISPGDSYSTGVLPAVSVFGLGMAITVAPLTSAVLASVRDEMAGVAAGVNNAVSRLAGLLAVAALPALAGFATDASIAAGLDEAYETALSLSAILCVLGGVSSAVLVRKAKPTRTTIQPSLFQACQDPCVEQPPESRAVA